jgi:ubiquinone/menaquinone biosynthesis C-methylase UbiE
MPNTEDEVFKTYRLSELPVRELLVHGDTEMVSKLFIKYLLPLIQKRAEKNGSIEKIFALELGGGTCFDSYYLKRKINKIEIVATDISPYVLKVSKSFPSLFKVKLDNYCACDAQHLPFRDNTFDVIFGTEFLHHCESLIAATREIARILVRNGFFLGIEPMCGGITKPIIMSLSGANWRTRNEHIRENRYNFAEWKNAFEKAELRVSISSIDNPEIYKSLIGKKCHPSCYKGRYLTKYIYSTFLNLVPQSFQKNAPNTTLKICGVKTR